MENHGNLTDTETVRTYWNTHPLLSHEFNEPGSPEYFDQLDATKRLDSDRFALDYWGFKAYSGKAIFDIGCGPGWVAVQYALGGADVTAVDLTERAVEITRKHAIYRSANLQVKIADAQALPFSDKSFDVVVASGVLHHTPDPQKAFAEAYRVAKPGGTGKITLYRKGILLAPRIFPATRTIMRMAGVRHPGSALAENSRGVDDFIRRYDGDDNPIGIGKSDAGWADDLRRVGWEVRDIETHFFPLRFIPASRCLPRYAHGLLDRCFGTMAYFTLRKPL